MVLDQGFTTGRAFGATGTPSAILIEADGTIGSEVAVGAQAVLSLASIPPNQDAPDGSSDSAATNEPARDSPPGGAGGSRSPQ